MLIKTNELVDKVEILKIRNGRVNNCCWFTWAGSDSDLDYSLFSQVTRLPGKNWVYANLKKNTIKLREKAIETKAVLMHELVHQPILYHANRV